MVGVLNFLDTFARLMFDSMVRQPYPLGLYLKPVFFFAQTVSLLLFIRSVRFVDKPVVSGSELSRFSAVHFVLAFVVVLLYVDFLILGFAGWSGAGAVMQLAFYLVYFAALSGTCFWFAWRLMTQNDFRWFSAVFVFVGLGFAAAFLEPMVFWSQNYAGLVFPSLLAYVGTYGPHVLMFFASVSCLAVVFQRRWLKQSRGLGFSLVLLFLAFLLPLLWDGYRDGLINFVIRDVFYWSFGYSGFLWFSVSFYFVSIVAYLIVWKAISRSSRGSLAFSLIALGVASFPWNGIVPFKVSYSSVPGNALSLSSIVTGVSLLSGQRGEK